MFNLDNQFWHMVRADWMVRDPILLVGGAVYEEVAAELRERDRLEAHRLREETALLRKRISGEASADAAVDEVRIVAERTRRIAAEGSAIVVT